MIKRWLEQLHHTLSKSEGSDGCPYYPVTVHLMYQDISRASQQLTTILAVARRKFRWPEESEGLDSWTNGRLPSLPPSRSNLRSLAERRSQILSLSRGDPAATPVTPVVVPRNGWGGWGPDWPLATSPA